MMTQAQVLGPAGSGARRIQFIDALRGLAALAVVLSHYNDRLDWSAFSSGNLGVPVFFVLSGFVVTMSVGDARINARFIGRFALRRALRLDPPYWATIAAVSAVGYAFAGQVKFDGITVPQVLSHMFYLQDILGFTPILPVFWTLCYEIQFYLSLVLFLWAMQAAGVRPHYAMIATLVASVVDRHHEITQAAFMGRFWFCFALGALAFWAARGAITRSWIHVVSACVFVFGAATGDGYALTSSTTAAAISLVLKFGRPNLLSGGAWQFMGRISYSLYLTHPLFGWLALRVAERFVPTPVAALFGIAVAIASAWAFYVLVERPAIGLSHRVSVTSAPRS